MPKRAGRMALFVLVLVAAGALLADWIPAHSYDAQTRDFPVGAGDLGRDRWARLLQGARVSLLLAPGAARWQPPSLTVLLAGLTLLPSRDREAKYA